MFHFRTKLICWTPTCSSWIGLSSNEGQVTTLGRGQDLKIISNLRLLSLCEKEVEKASKTSKLLLMSYLSSVLPLAFITGTKTHLFSPQLFIKSCAIHHISVSLKIMKRTESLPETI